MNKLFTLIISLFFCFNSLAVTMNFKNVDVRVFIDKVSELTGKSFIIDSDVSGLINLSANSNMNNDRLYSLFLETLKLHNLIAITTEDNFIKILPISKVKQHLAPSKTKIINLNYAYSKDLILTLNAIKFKDNNDFIERSLQFDNFTNSIIVSGSLNFIKTVHSTIKGLDIKKSQVLIEAIVLEISSSNTKDLGIDWVSKNSSSLGFLNFTKKHFKILINALEQSGSANILSTPSIVTLDDNEAEIIVGQEVPFITTSGTNSDSKSFQNFERKDVGLKLKVKPHINNNGDILLSINQEMSYLLPSSVASDLITSKRQIKTSVMMKNNQLLVLGGLIDDSSRDTEKSLPILGDIPILGSLFSHSVKTKEKRNLLVFLRLTILSDEIINDISNKHFEKITSIFAPVESHFTNLDESQSFDQEQSQSIDEIDYYYLEEWD